VALFSQFLGFFAWNKGLSLGGIARIGQLLLLQPFVTLIAASLLLGESIGWMEVVFCVVVLMFVALGWRMRVSRTPYCRFGYHCTTSPGLTLSAAINDDDIGWCAISSLPEVTRPTIRLTALSASSWSGMPT
jgi:hypothetical protein